MAVNLTRSYLQAAGQLKCVLDPDLWQDRASRARERS
jgi:hypothetical protein